MSEELWVYIDGKYYPKSEAKISVYDHGFLYGDGVFEGIRAYNGIVFKLDEHLERLYNSAKAIALEIPLTKEELKKAIIETLKKNGLRDGYIRLVISRGIGDLGLDPRKCPKPSIVIITEPLLQLHKKDVREKGISTHISWVRRDPVDATSHEVKSLNYLNSILARIEANNAGADEGICLDTRGFISEGTGENIFIVKNGELYTPPSTAGALKGITRGVVIKLASNLGYKVIERDITINDLFSADEVFLTGTAAEIAPVTEVNKRIIGDGKPGPITKALMENFYKLVRSPEEGTPIE